MCQTLGIDYPLRNLRNGETALANRSTVQRQRCAMRAPHLRYRDLPGILLHLGVAEATGFGARPLQEAKARGCQAYERNPLGCGETRARPSLPTGAIWADA